MAPLTIKINVNSVPDTDYQALADKLYAACASECNSIHAAVEALIERPTLVTFQSGFVSGGRYEVIKAGK